MPGPDPRGSVFSTRNGVRHPLARGRQAAAADRLPTKTEAREWFAEQRRAAAARRARPTRRSPSTRSATCTSSAGARPSRSGRRRRSRSGSSPAREQFGDWTLRELEGAAADIADVASRAHRHVALPADARDAADARTPPSAGATCAEPGRRRRARTRSRARRSSCRSRATRSTRSPPSSARSTGRSSSSPPRPGCGRTSGSRSSGATSTRPAQAVTVQRRFADGVLTPYPKTERSRRRVPLTARALDAIERLPPRLDTPLVFPAPRGRLLSLDNWRTREWYAGARRRRDRAARPVPPAPHLRDRGARRRRLDLRARAR